MSTEIVPSPSSIPKPAPPTVRILNSLDRCDRCDAQAYVRVLIPKAATSLQFCGSHWRRNEAAIRRLPGLSPLDVIDETRSIVVDANLVPNTVP